VRPGRHRNVVAIAIGAGVSFVQRLQIWPVIDNRYSVPIFLV